MNDSRYDCDPNAHKYSTDWEQFPPIDGDGDPVGSARMLGWVLIGSVVFWGVVIALVVF